MGRLQVRPGITEGGPGNPFERNAVNDPVEQLRKLGYTVNRFSQWHHRVDGVFDFWTTKRGDEWHWHDLSVDERGVKPPDQIVYFIQQRVGKPNTSTHVTKAEFIRRLVEIGWTPGESEAAWKEKQSRLTS